MSSPPDSARREHDNQALQDERFRLLVQGVTDYAIFMLDPEGHVICWNTGAEHVFGYQEWEVVGQHYSCFFPSEEVQKGEPDRELRTAADHGRFEGECSRVRKDGSRFLANVVLGAVRQGGSGHLLGFSQITRDITEQCRVEERLRQAQKLEAVATLAAGVAHDFNNLLLVINGYSDILLGTLHEHDQARGMVEEIAKAGHRAASLTRQLLAFGRRQMLEPRVLDLNALLGEVEPLFRRLVGENVEFILSRASDLRNIQADASQVEQVVINLVVNARDAMPRGGRLTVQTVNADLGVGYPGDPEVRAGPYVRLSVTDTGMGMDEATKARIFEPFFSTKEVGKGTGLGLSTVFGIVKQSGGHVEVASKTGAGSTFTVYLPGVEGPPRGEQAHPYSPRGAGGQETLLLVEDEAGVRDLGQHLLQKVGYKVLIASNGGEALEVADHYTGPIHLLVTDVVMPGISGLQVANRMKPLRPEMRVLYLSGYSLEAVASLGVLGAEMPFLQKPYSSKVLANKVREILDG